MNEALASQIKLAQTADANMLARVVYTGSASAEEAGGRRRRAKLLSIADVGALKRRIVINQTEGDRVNNE
jgi:hypothetical protein